ncbi:MAG: anti-sigma-factor antagonist [Armatimonadetes bacterium]|jgi:anti-anti-sigma factor|nr:anti-sigma-factor antagonist [Armatimonadota bacterium]
MKTAFNIVETSESEGVVVLRLGGELDLLAASEFKEQLARVLPGAERLVIDLGDVQFIDSAGMGLLCSAMKRMHAGGKECQFVNAHGQPLKLLQISGLAATGKRAVR